MSLVPRVVSRAPQPRRLNTRGAHIVGVLAVMFVGFSLMAAPAAAQDVPNPPSNRQTSDLVDRVNGILKPGTTVGVPEGPQAPKGLNIARLMEEARQLCESMEGQEDTSNAFAQLCKGVTSRPGGTKQFTAEQLADAAKKNPLNLLDPDAASCRGGSIRLPGREKVQQDRNAEQPPVMDAFDEWSCEDGGRGTCTRTTFVEGVGGHKTRVTEQVHPDGSRSRTEAQIYTGTRLNGWSDTKETTWRWDSSGSLRSVTEEYYTAEQVEGGVETPSFANTWERNDSLGGWNHTQRRDGRVTNKRHYPNSSDLPPANQESSLPPLTREMGLDSILDTGLLEQNLCTEADKRWNNLANLLYGGMVACPSPVEDGEANDDAVGPAPGGPPCDSDPPNTAPPPDPLDPGGPGLGDGNGLGRNLPILKKLPPLLKKTPCLGPLGDCAP